MQYQKPAIDIAQQIQKLESRGLVIADKAVAAHFLSQISYYRLAGYWWPMQSDKVKHKFKEGATFKAVVDLYNFDRELRLIAFNMIERIEIAIRTQLIYHLSMAYGPHWLEDKDLFQHSVRWVEHLNKIKNEVDRSKEVFIKAHRKKYKKDHRFPPSWKSLEVISLGLLSKLYENLKNSLPEKKQIAKNLQAGNHTFLTSWLQSITVVRNICAHHSRLWNRNLPTPPKLLKKAPLPWIDTSNLDPHKLYAVISAMQYLLLTISPGNHFPQRLKQLFQDYPNVDYKPMDFPADWHEQPLWFQN